MDPAHLNWDQLQPLIVRKIAERYVILRREITENARGRVRGSGPKPLELSTSFRLARREDAENWLSVRRNDCVQLLEERNRLRSPDLWEFLLAVSKEEAEPRIRELLNISFRISPKQIESIENWKYEHWLTLPDEDFIAEHFGSSSRFNIAIAKKDAVDQIVCGLFGWSGERPFGIPSVSHIPEAEPAGATAADLNSKKRPGRAGCNCGNTQRTAAAGRAPATAGG